MREQVDSMASEPGGACNAAPLAFEPDFEARFRRPLIRFFAKRLDDSSEAEDMAHELLVRLSAARSGNVDNPDAYVFQMASNMLRDRYRKQVVRDRYANDIRHSGEMELDVIDPERIAASRQQLEGIVAAIQAMPELTRQIVVLSRFEGMSRKELAEKLGVSISTVTNHLCHGLARLTVLKDPKDEHFR